MKDFKIIELMELFDESEVIPASQMQRPQSALDREMFQDANKRLNFLYALICFIDCSTFHCWLASTIIKHSSPIVFLINSSLLISASRSKPTFILKCFHPLAMYC